ncbi:hypothetical protein BH11PSE2_BH11PSE2_08220 [soil metagenome]
MSLTNRTTLLWVGVTIAAALALGLVIGMRAPTFGLVGRDFTASGDLVDALDNQAAAIPGSLDPVHIGSTFRDESGGYCRTFQTPGEKGMAGIACRSDGRWRVRLVFSTPIDTSDYQRAAAEPLAVIAAARAMMAGDPLSPADEAAARRRDWR